MSVYLDVSCKNLHHDQSGELHMQVGVIVPTVDRGEAVQRLVEALHRQTYPVSQVVVCAPDHDSIPEALTQDPLVTLVVGPRGASAQRNAALAKAHPDMDVIAFFDDDALPRDDYMAQAVAVLDTHPEVVALNGRVVRDGVREGIALDEGEMYAALQESWSGQANGVRPTRELYGVGIVVRGQAARETPFDERLPLYSWLEDLDFARRLTRRGGFVTADSVVLVHQGSPSGGRRQHKRLGYSQIANPVYLGQKGSLGVGDVLLMVARPIVGTVRGLILGRERVARLQRLHGMTLAAVDLARGRVQPERIIDL